jgi:hypothetical protein
MRYLFGLICVLALGVMPSVGCSETTGDGGSGGSAGSGGTVRDYAWGVAESISGDGYPENFSLAVNDAGVALVAWTEGAESALWVNRYVPGSGWGSPERIESGGLGSRTPEIAIAPNGTAVLVWEDTALPGEIRANHYTPSSGWATAVRISPETGSAYAPHVAMDGNGNAISAWQQIDSEANYVVLAARFTPAGQWEEAQSIDSGTAGYESWPDVAMDPSGNAVVVWHGYDSQGDAGILANSYTLQEGWAGAQPANTPTDRGTAYWPDVDMDAEGNAIAVWVQADYEGDVWTEGVWSNRLTQDGGWGTAESFETTDSSDPRDPQISMNAGGVAIAIWQRVENGGGRYTIWSARYDPARGWDPEEQVDVDRGDQDYGYYPQVAVDPLGDALAVWQGGSADPHVWSSRGTLDEGWESSVRLDSESNAERPLIGVDAQGRGLAVWYQGSGPSPGLWANRYSEEATANADTGADMVTGAPLVRLE